MCNMQNDSLARLRSKDCHEKQGENDTYFKTRQFTKVMIFMSQKSVGFRN